MDYSLTALLRGWRLQALLWSVLLSALGYVAFSLWSGYGEVLSSLGRIGWLALLQALALVLLGYALRTWRWHIYLAAQGHRLPWRLHSRIYLAGFALTTTPGKAGEMLRSLLLAPYQVPYPQSVAAFVAERLADGVAMALLTLPWLWLYMPAYSLPLLLAVALLLYASSRVPSLRLWLENRRLYWHHYWQQQRPQQALRWQAWLAHLRLFRPLLAPRRLLSTTVLSLLAWSLEALALLLLLGALPQAIGIRQGFFSYAASMLLGALSFLPGGLGGTEASMVALLTAFELGLADATAVTLVFRLLTLWLSVALGLLALLWHQLSNANKPPRQLASNAD